MRLLWRLLVTTLALWAAGLVWFSVDALRPGDSGGHADGIVVLTGDADRIEAALDLLHQGRGRLLLISGTGPRVSLAALAPAGETRISGRITLGRAAISTYGNGQEFAAWAHQNGIGSALVVTSFYHMRRALLELNRAAPDVALTPVKVPQRPLLAKAGARKLFDDYNKYLLALIGLSRFSPGHRLA